MATLLSTNPAKILGIERTIKKGYNANLTIIDPDKEITVSRETLYTKSLNTPFLGQTLKGVAITTIINGRVAFERE